MGCANAAICKTCEWEQRMKDGGAVPHSEVTAKVNTAKLRFIDQCESAGVMSPALAAEPRHGELSKGTPEETFRESPKTLLQEADAIINGERQKDYGPPAESFGRIARLWSDYLDQELTALDVANLMILLKVSRAKTGGFHRDSYVDCAGYAGAAELIMKEQGK